MIRPLWHPETVYLNTASFGLPPDPAWEALQQAQEDWRHGRVSWEHWTAVTDRARAEFATLTRSHPEHVVVGANVSGLDLARRDRAPRRLEGPRARAGVHVAAVPVPGAGRARRHARRRPARQARGSDRRQHRRRRGLRGAVLDGELADLDAIAAAAHHHGARTIIDATHAIGWLPIDATRFDAVACAAYKWLMSPRGTAFMVLKPELADTLNPDQAGWYAAANPLTDQFGPPLRLAPTARRFDTSPAWFSWVGTEPALQVINEIGVEAIHAHDLALANRFRAGLGEPEGNSAIVTSAVPDATEKLARAGIMAAARAGRLRASFHLYNTEADVDAALNALT